MPFNEFKIKKKNNYINNINKNFTLDNMTIKLGEIFNKYIKIQPKPQHIELKLPTIKKL